MNNVYKGWTVATTNIVDEATATKAVSVTISKNANSLDLTFKGLTSKEGLIQAIKLYIDKLESSVMIDDTIDFTVPAPTTAEALLADYNTKLARLDKIMYLVEKGVIPANHAKVAEAQDDVRQILIANPSYL